MNLIKTSEKNITAIMMGVAICFSFFVVSLNAAHAEETTETPEATTTSETSTEDASDDSAKRAAMFEKITALKAIIAERKAAFKMEREESKTEFKAMKEEKKAEFKINREEFAASLEGLTEEERRAKMMEFVKNLQEVIAAKKAEMKTHIEAKKESLDMAKQDFKAERNELKSNYDGKSKEDKLASLMEKISALKAQIEAKKKLESDEDEDEDDSNDDV